MAAHPVPSVQIGARRLPSGVRIKSVRASSQGQEAPETVVAGGGGVAWPVEEVLRDFKDVHEGAWEGTTAKFTCQGEAIELPRALQTEPALEWGFFEVEQPHREEWHVSESIKSGPLASAQKSLFYPEAGCAFGEEVVASQEHRDLFAGGDFSKTLLACGAYNDGPVMLPSKPGEVFTVESCLLPMDIPEEGPGEPAGRLRVRQHLRMREETVEVVSIEVSREVPEGSGSRTHFASSKRTDEEALTSGAWQASHGGTLSATIDPHSLRMIPFWGISPRPVWSGAASAHRISDVDDPRAGSGVALTLLPCGAWSLVANRHGILLVEAGELVGARRRRVSARVYSDGALEQSIIGEDWRWDGWDAAHSDLAERRMVEQAYIGYYGALFFFLFFFLI